MKKIFAALLLILCVIFVFAGCSGSEEAEPSDSSHPGGFSLDPPTLEGVTPIASGVKLSWKAVEGAEYYSVLLSQKDGTWMLLDTTSYLQFTDKDAQNNQEYTYTVICSSKSGEQMSAPSENKTLKFYTAPQISKIYGLTSGVRFSWEAIEGIESYRVMRKTTGGNWETIGHTEEAIFTDENAQSNTQYTYTVCCEAKDQSALLSGYSEKGKTLRFLSAPAISKVGYTASGVTVEWDPVEGAESYRVMRKTNDGEWERVKTVTTPKYTDNGVENNTKYTYTIRCVTAEGDLQSGFSTKGRSVYYFDAPVLTGLTQDEDDVLITWDAVEGAEAYRIYRKPKDGKWEAIASTSETRYWDEDLETATYVYTVRCVTADNKSIRSGSNKGVEIELE